MNDITLHDVTKVEIRGRKDYDNFSSEEIIITSHGQKICINLFSEKGLNLIKVKKEAKK